jgi:hypothetical protein
MNVAGQMWTLAWRTPPPPIISDNLYVVLDQSHLSFGDPGMNGILHVLIANKASPS